jgi:hypothetical protein
MLAPLRPGFCTLFGLRHYRGNVPVTVGADAELALEVRFNEAERSSRFWNLASEI